MHAQVDGNVEHPRALGEVHPEKEDVAPSAMRQVHPDGSALAQDRMRRVAVGGAQQFGPDAQRLVERVAEAEHPCVAPRGAHSMAHLVGKRLKAERVVRRSQRARKRFACALRGLRAKETADRLLESALQHPAETVVWHPAGAQELGPGRQVIAVYRREEEQRADAPVQVGLLPAVAFEFGAGGKQLGGRPAGTPAFNREIPRFRRRGLDDVGDAEGHGDLSVLGGIFCRRSRHSARRWA